MQGGVSHLQKHPYKVQDSSIFGTWNSWWFIVWKNSSSFQKIWHMFFKKTLGCFRILTRWAPSPVISFRPISPLIGVVTQFFLAIYCGPITILRGSGYLGYVDSNQGYNLYFPGLYVPVTRVINLHITSYNRILNLSVHLWRLARNAHRL